MDIFIKDYINTFNVAKQRRAGVILDTLKVEKSNLGLVANRLSQFGISSALFIPDELPNAQIGVGKNSITFRDIANRMINMYNESSTISLLLDGFSSALLADIGSLEGEVAALEKALSNYGFLLSDGGSYDYAFLEPFSDEHNRDSFDFELSDRSSLVFSQSQEAVVDTQEGTLGIADRVDIGYPIQGVIISSNAENSQTSDTGINGATNGDLKTGWRVSINTTRALQATLPLFKGLYGQQEWVGAQYIVEFILDKPSPADVVRISPFTDFPFELTQVELFPSHADAGSLKILAQPRKLEMLTSISFSLQTVQRVRLYLRQPTFQNDGTLTVFPPEDQLKPIVSGYNNLYIKPIPAPTITPPQLPSASLYQIVRRGGVYPFLPDPYLQRNYNLNSSKTVAFGSIVDQYKGKKFEDFLKLFTVSSQHILSSFRQVFAGFFSDTNLIPGWRPQTNFNYSPLIGVFDHFFNIVKVDTPIPVSFPPESLPPVPIPTPIPSPISSPIKYINVDPTVYQLKKYNLGLQFVKIGVGAKGNKGVFVTKPFPAPGDMGEVKIKVNEINHSATNTSQDMPLVTFVEYSVTNKSNPTMEADWIPILPVDGDDTIKEYLLVDDTGITLLRFPAAPDKSIIIYKNGYKTDFSVDDLLIKSDTTNAILGLQIPTGLVSTSDNLICEYTPVADVKTVNFHKAGFDNPPLVSSYDTNGPGESFAGTNGDLTINLSFQPFIDYSQVSSSTYNKTMGLTPYSPIIITLSDGIVPINLTNYQAGDQTTLDPNSSDYQYIHNKNVLLFNKAITQSLKVYYQYLPSNVRLRVILRSATGSFIGPKVDWVQIKGKTRKADMKKV